VPNLQDVERHSRALEAHAVVSPVVLSPKGKDEEERPPDNSGGLYERLRALGTDRLAALVLALADPRDAETRRLIDEACANVSGVPTAAPSGAEDAEPYMVGSSPAMHRVFATIRKFGATNAPLLITGESGTGKELAAHAVHERSAYAKGPFVAINCAALPPTLIAAELFGYEKGAFTGATQRRIGRLESANGGTIFLDEIGDLPLEQQAHLLRFLQERTIDRVGGTRPITVEARVIVATNVDLRRAVQAKQFREDLFYRLNVLTLHLPSLRERGHDIELLATFFLRKFAEEQGRVVAGFTDDAWEKIRGHDWPGNVRELIGCIRRAVVMAEKPWITTHDLGLDENLRHRVAGGRLPEAPRRTMIDETALREALRKANGNVTSAARALDVSRMTIYRLMRRHGVEE
jgi:DNA-binding NtrC family response regulator